MKKILVVITVLLMLVGFGKIIVIRNQKIQEKKVAIEILQKNKEIVEKIDNILKNDSFNGSILIANENGIVLKKGYGYADFEKKVKNTSETKFQIGSITKQFTAACILKLVEENKIKLNDPITKYVDFPNGEKITIHNLLSHSSGIKEYFTYSSIQELNIKKEYIPDEIVNLVKNKSLNFKPGENYEYSNTNYILLGMIIEKVTGLSYKDYLEKNIFDKIDMKNSGIENDYYKNLENISIGYENNIKYKKAQETNMSFPYSAGGVYSSVEDLYKWDRALYTKEILSENMKNMMFKTQNATGYYGYGWVISADNKVVHHRGHIMGFCTYIFRNMTKKSVIILLSNSDTVQFDKEVSKINVEMGKLQN